MIDTFLHDSMFQRGFCLFFYGVHKDETCIPIITYTSLYRVQSNGRRHLVDCSRMRQNGTGLMRSELINIVGNH